MPAALEIKVDSRELERLLNGLPPKIQRAVLRKQLRESGKKIARQLKAGTPRRTGLGARSVRVKVRSTERQAFAKISYRGRRAAVLGMRERGTRRQSARPFFQAATAGFKEEVLRDFSSSLREAVESARSAL